MRQPVSGTGPGVTPGGLLTFTFREVSSELQSPRPSPWDPCVGSGLNVCRSSIPDFCVLCLLVALGSC